MSIYPRTTIAQRVNFVVQEKLKKIKDIAINNIAPESEELMRENIQNIVYGYPEGEYERTFDLLNSVTSEVKDIENGIMISIYPDTDEIIPRGFGQHRSWVKPFDDQSEHIPHWVAEGTDRGLAPMPERDFGSATADKVNVIVKKYLKGV